MIQDPFARCFIARSHTPKTDMLGFFTADGEVDSEGSTVSFMLAEKVI